MRAGTISMEEVDLECEREITVFRLLPKAGVPDQLSLSVGVASWLALRWTNLVSPSPDEQENWKNLCSP